MILVAGIFAAGLVSANTTDSKAEKTAEVSTSSVAKEKPEEKKPVGLSNDTGSGSDCTPIYHTTSCGVAASTCQSGWSGPRMMEWAYALEANYCG